MIKVKLIRGDYIDSLEDRINNFIKRNPQIKIIDIKLCVAADDEDLYERALIIYEEEE